tara:strand:+ start:4358 stop:5383 length:1026 start_codon:yes stop_codon:yes gene_type:complete
MITIAEYIWLDGSKPEAKVRNKVKVIPGDFRQREFPFVPNMQDNIPLWGFDGSSTQQASGDNSDCVLKPVRVYRDVTRHNGILVLCEVMNVDMTPHESNHRDTLSRNVLNTKHEEPWFGIEQEYTLYSGTKPLGWPEEGEPAPQGDYYCGRNSGEGVMQDHLEACLGAGVGITGTNAEVMLGQWEYQVGTSDPLRVADDLWIARWLMEKVASSNGCTVSLHPKPESGDWNGAGAHTNFSTKAMRDKDGDLVIHKAIKKLEEKHHEHIDVYGADNDKRLTGKHETCDINTFKWGVSDRGASVRIPWQVSQDGKGYLEDRRPSANCDPYIVCNKLLETICLNN